MPGVISPGVVSVAGVNEPEPVSRFGIGGTLMPNCDSPCDSADNSSLGRSVIREAWTNSRCWGAGFVSADNGDG